MALTDKLTNIADAIRGKTRKSGKMSLDQMVTEIEEIKTVTEEWQRPANWPDLSSLGKPEPGTCYFTYDCRDHINGNAPGVVDISVWSFRSAARGRVENGKFIVVEELDSLNGKYLPKDEGDFVVYRLTHVNNFGFNLPYADSRKQDCVEVYGTSYSGKPYTSNSYTGVCADTIAFTMFDCSSPPEYALVSPGTGRTTVLEYLHTDSCAGSFGAYCAFRYMGNPNLKKLSLPADTSAVTNMNCMFKECKSLRSLDVSSFDTSAVQNMDSMLSGCQNLRALDLSHFNTSSVTKMNNMFRDCKKLYTLDFSGLDTSSVTDTTVDMFTNCHSLVNLKVGKINKNFKFSNCWNLSHESLMNVIEALEETENTLTLTIGSSNLGRLTEEEIAIATEKGWSVV